MLLLLASLTCLFLPLHASIPNSWDVTTIAGTGVANSTDGSPLSSSVNAPGPLEIGEIDEYLVLYFFDHGESHLRLYGEGLNTFNPSSSGDGFNGDGAIDDRQFSVPQGLLGCGNNLLIADTANHRIRIFIYDDDLVVTIAGSGTPGSVDDYDKDSSFNSPYDIAGTCTSGSGTVYVTDYNNHRVRKVEYSEGSLTSTLAGSSAGYTDATGTNAQFNFPTGIAMSPDETYLVVADSGNNLLRHIVISTGVVTTLCGASTTPGSDDGACTSASFTSPHRVGFFDSSNLIVLETTSSRFRVVDLDTETVSFFLGGTEGFQDGDEDVAQFDNPGDFVVFPGGSGLFVSDTGNNRLRLISPGTSDAPTLVPTAVPTESSAEPTSAPTSSPSAVPTSMPTESVAEHIFVHLVDTHGDGWGDDMYLSVLHSGASEPVLYSLQCACKVVRLFSESGDMMISMIRNSTHPIPFEWEALWTAGYSDGLTTSPFGLFGGVNTELVISNWGLDSSSHVLDTDANAPKHKCIQPPPPKPRPSSDKSVDSNSSYSKDEQPGPLPIVNVRLVLSENNGNGWCDDSGLTHVFTCSKENVFSPDATLPNLLTYPRYFISDAEGRVLMQQGTMRVAEEENVRDVKLPREGAFVFSVSGHDTTSASDRRFLSESSTISWDFCGEQGGLNERLHFNMVHGVCKAHYIEEVGEVSCEGEWATSQLLTSPIDHLLASTELSEIRSGLQIAILISGAIGGIALLVIVYRSKSPRKVVRFDRLDTSDHP